MSVRIQFDRQHGATYTNLDFVTGRVLLNLPDQTTISRITVKLEGESITKLDIPKHPLEKDKKRSMLEVHKILYKVETVFPDVGLQRLDPEGTSQYTLQAGQYTYPFSLKIPFNTGCVNNRSAIKDVKMGGMSLQFQQEPQHKYGPLPPSLGGFTGVAEIKYFVKATAKRPKFYQENIRSEVPITFLPIESPRPQQQISEVFGRRKHQFSSRSSSQSSNGIFFRKGSIPVPQQLEPLSFQVDVRLPNPAIFTCHQPLSMRILLERLNEGCANIHLSMLQVELIATTEIRTYDLFERAYLSHLIVSKANLNLPLQQTGDVKKAVSVPNNLWNEIPIPNTVLPSFRTCNLSRSYELDVRIGLTHSASDGIRPEMIVSNIRLPVEIWSGIKPPPALIESMQQAGHLPPSPVENKPASPVIDRDGRRLSLQSQSSYHPGSDAHLQNSHRPPRVSTFPQGTPQPSGPYSPQATTNPAFDDEAPPPSYEDAIASSSSRQIYASAPTQPRNTGHSSPTHPLSVTTPQRPPRPKENQKTPQIDKPAPTTSAPVGSTGISRRTSERLFNSNAAQPPSRNTSGRSRRSHGNDDSIIEQVERELAETNLAWQEEHTQSSTQQTRSGDTKGEKTREERRG